MEQQRINKLQQIIKKAKLDLSVPPVVRQSGNRYGIEFEGNQTFLIEIEPVFDMTEEQIDAIVNLMALAPVVIPELLDKFQTKDKQVEALVDCVTTVALVASEKMRGISSIEVMDYEDEEDNPTVGEE